MTAGVYIETSIISYLTGRLSRDVVVAGHQALTRRWWRGRRAYNLFISQAVIDEAALGDPVMRTRRLKALRAIPRLALSDQATALANELVHRGALPKKATVDGFHIAIAAAHQIDYLLTWNCKHLANATLRGTIEDVCRSQGLRPPIILHARGITVREFQMKHRDAILDDLHKIRRAIGKAHNFDVHRIAATIRRHEAESRQPVIRGLPKRAVRPRRAS